MTDNLNSREGLTANTRQAEYAVKKYKSQRKVGAGIMMDVHNFIFSATWLRLDITYRPFDAFRYRVNLT